MTTIKERIILLSRNKKVERIYTICILILVVACLLLKLWAKKNVAILTVVLILALIGYKSLDELSKLEIEFLRRNKIKYIILSNKDIMDVCLTWTIGMPIILNIDAFIKGTSLVELLVGIVVMIFALVLVKRITNIITRYFRKKVV